MKITIKYQHAIQCDNYDFQYVRMRVSPSNSHPRHACASQPCHVAPARSLTLIQKDSFQMVRLLEGTYCDTCINISKIRQWRRDTPVEATAPQTRAEMNTRARIERAMMW